MSDTDYFNYMRERDRRSLMSQPLGMNNVGYMDDTTSVDPSNYLASLLGQGTAMLGAGIAGRDPGRVSEGINDMRVFADRMRQAQAQQKQEALFRQQAQEEQRIKNEQLIKNQQEALEFKKQEQEREKQKLKNEEKLQVDAEDSRSEISKKQRMLYGNIFGIDINENISANDFTKPGVLQGLKEMAERKRQEEALAKQQKFLPRGGGGGVRQPAQPKPEKESKEEQKNIQSFKEAITENQKFLKQVDDYSKLVKKIPISGGITEEGASKIAAAQALRGKLLLSLKNIEKTGALDQGMINVADGILGSADYTRESVVDARANQLKQTIKDDIESNYIKYGILGIQQGEDGNYYYVDKNNKPILKYQGNINGKN